MSKFTLYDWQKMSKKDLLCCRCFVCMSLEDQILLSDWFSCFRELISPKDLHPNFELHLEGQLHGLKSIFLITGTESVDHQVNLNDLTYQLIFTSRHLSFTTEERANYIFDAWLERLLNLYSH